MKSSYHCALPLVSAALLALTIQAPAFGQNDINTQTVAEGEQPGQADLSQSPDTNEYLETERAWESEEYKSPFKEDITHDIVSKRDRAGTVGKMEDRLGNIESRLSVLEKKEHIGSKAEPSTLSKEQQPGVQEGSNLQSGQDVQSSDQSQVSGSSQEESLSKKDMAKMELGAPAVGLEGSLQSALVQVKGLRAELKAHQNRPIHPNYVSDFRSLGREINLDLMHAMKQDAQIKSRIQKHPDLAGAKEFQAIDPAIKNVSSLNRNWQAKLADSAYWTNLQAVNSDLDQFERRLQTAAERARSFSSTLDISSFS